MSKIWTYHPLSKDRLIAFHWNALYLDLMLPPNILKLGNSVDGLPEQYVSDIQFPRAPISEGRLFKTGLASTVSILLFLDVILVLLFLHTKPTTIDTTRFLGKCFQDLKNLLWNFLWIFSESKVWLTGIEQLPPVKSLVSCTAYNQQVHRNVVTWRVNLLIQELYTLRF